MIRFTKALALGAAMLTIPTVASALGISIVNSSETVENDNILEVGESITFDLVVENDAYEQIFALDVIAFGHDETPGIFGTVSSGLQVTGGAVTTSLFDQVPGFGGLGPNIVSGPTRIFTTNNLRPEFVRHQLFGGINFSGTTADGQIDTGIGGGSIASGDVHFQITFTNQRTQIAAEDITLSFGTNIDMGAVAVGNGGAILPFNNASVNLTVIPEPGTALLMGIGLAGLAASNRRR